jgi:ribose/xylose/arabinose/galactoside ABC-type transport system permease subunit
MNNDDKKSRLSREDVMRGAGRFVRHENGILVIILIAISAALAGLTKGFTISRPNVSNVILQSSTRGIASIGQSFVILTSGIDLSVGGLSLLCMIVGASIMKGTTGIPAAGVLAMIFVGIGIGAANGSAVSRIGMPALIVTLSVWQITEGASFVITQGRTIGNLPDFISFIGQGNVGGVPVPVTMFVTVAVIAYLVLNYTTFGRSVYAVGGNPGSAWLSGINVTRILFSVYVISGFCAAMAGLITLGRLGSASMAASTGLELDSIAAAVIGGVSLMGGRGTMIGVVIGTIIIGIINNGMNALGVHPAYQSIVKGSVIFAAVAVDYVRRRRQL